MRKTITVITFVLLVGGLLFTTLQPASSQAPGGRTITLFDPNKTDFDKEINEGGDRFGAGDWSVTKDSIYDPESCEKNGTFLGRFTFVKGTGQEDGFFLVDAGVILDDGKLTFYWPGRFSEFANPDAATSGGAITGGTGAYEGAGGSIVVEEDVEMCDRRGALVTISLTN